MRGKGKQGRPKKTWKIQVEKESKNVDLEKDALNQVKWRVGVGEITGVNPVIPTDRDKPRSQLD